MNSRTTSPAAAPDRLTVRVCGVDASAALITLSAVTLAIWLMLGVLSTVAGKVPVRVADRTDEGKWGTLILDRCDCWDQFELNTRLNHKGVGLARVQWQVVLRSLAIRPWRLRF